MKGCIPHLQRDQLGVDTQLQQVLNHAELPVTDDHLHDLAGLAALRLCPMQHQHVQNLKQATQKANFSRQSSCIVFSLHRDNTIVLYCNCIVFSLHRDNQIVMYCIFSTQRQSNCIVLYCIVFSLHRDNNVVLYFLYRDNKIILYCSIFSLYRDNKIVLYFLYTETIKLY